MMSMLLLTVVTGAITQIVVICWTFGVYPQRRIQVPIDWIQLVDADRDPVGHAIAMLWEE